MNQGYGLNYTPNFYMVRDSGQVPSGMDCLQLQPHQLRTQPFHYLINEQAKSLLALQELQNEVGALLEFRDLVMETFPNLRQKMSTSGSHTFSNGQNYCSNTPVQLSASLNSRQWEPGIKVKRKIVNKSDGDGSFGRLRSNSHGSKIHSSQPKSSEAISGVQDSGFSTETNSSNKDHVSGTTTSVNVHGDDPFRKEGAAKESRRCDYDRSDEDFSEDGMVMKVNEAEEELWNLLDVIHTKGTKLREEVETLQLRLVVEEIENHIRVRDVSGRKSEKRSGRRCRSLENFDGASLSGTEVDSYQNQDSSVEFKKRTRSIELEDAEHIRQERNMLLNKLAEMETENVASRIKNSELQSEISALISTKEELQEQLFQAMKQKNELNSRIHELHLKFVTGDRRSKLPRKSDKDNPSVMTDSESSQTDSSSLSRSKSSDDTHKLITNAKNSEDLPGRNSCEPEKCCRMNPTRGLGALDGVVTDPKKLRDYWKLSRPSRTKLEAILKERNYLELQRHLLVSVAENQALNTQLDKYKEENDQLKFSLEERNIELEGTLARVRVLERLQQVSKKSTDSSKLADNFTFLENDHLKSRGFSEMEINRAREIFMKKDTGKVDKGSNVLPILALPLPELSSNQSSGTESTQALEISSELEADMVRVDKGESLKSPYRRRPSKIPLNIQKSPGQKKIGTGNPSLKKTETTRKTPDHLQTSITSRSVHNPTSIRYGSIGRTTSQQSITSQKGQQSLRKKEDASLTSNGSAGRTLSLKQTTNFSNIRQRDTLTRKGHTDQAITTDSKRTFRRSLRDSFRGRISESGAAKKEPGQPRRGTSPSGQQKTKSVITTDNDTTKVNEPSESDRQLESDSKLLPGRSELDVDPKSNIFREVKRSFQKKIAEKITQNLGIKLFQNVEPHPWPRDEPEIRFFDSIDNSLDIDHDDSLLINSCSYQPNPSNVDETAAEIDSLE